MIRGLVLLVILMVIYQHFAFTVLEYNLLHGHVRGNNLVIVAALIFADSAAYDLIMTDLIDEVAAWARDVAL